MPKKTNTWLVACHTCGKTAETHNEYDTKATIAAHTRKGHRATSTKVS